MSTIINYYGKKIVLIKGASEMILSSCISMMSCFDGNIKNLDEGKLKELGGIIASMAKKSLRTICVAYREL